MSNFKGTTWCFVDKPTLPTSTLMIDSLGPDGNVFNVRLFNSNGYPFNSLSVTTTGILYDYYLEPNNPRLEIYAYKKSTNKWDDNKYKVITFANEPTFMDDGFIEWFQANAKQLQPLAGTTWTFNDTVNLTTCGCESNKPLFFSKSSTCTRLGCASSYISYYRMNGIDDIVYDTDFDGWQGTGHQTISFMREPDSFTPEQGTFITWLETNAIKQEKEVVDVITTKILYDDIRTRIDTKASINSMPIASRPDVQTIISEYEG